MYLPVKKIVIIGPESTGKSTITKAIADYYQTLFVPEMARTYLEEIAPRPYIYSDLEEIAKRQIEREETLQKEHKGRFLFCDTDLYVLKVWSEHKYGKCAPFILEQIAQRRYDFYFLTDIDIPWAPDPQREHPEPKMRQYFKDIYKDIVIQSGIPWKLLSGTPETRLRTAIQTLKEQFDD